MSTVITPAVGPAATPIAALRHPDIFVADRLLIPGWVCDHDSYRRWAQSEDYPESGWVSFLNGAIYVDMGMEELFTHNQVKQAFNVAVGMLLLQKPTGRFVPDRMLYTNVSAGLTTEPDGLYAHWATMQSGLLKFSAGKSGGCLELEGTADMILEIVSQYSETKDTVKLRALYEKARIPEYWLVDVRKQAIRFEILRLTGDAYQCVPTDDEWVKSAVFGCSFQLVRGIDPLGQPQFFVKAKS
jgi:Uma2 family endonuclease